MVQYILKFDGCCNPNPGEMGLGAVVWNEKHERIIEISEKAGFGTNNQAEYNAIIKGLEELSRSFHGDLLIQGDSQLVIFQLKGEWKVKKDELKPLYEKVKELEKQFNNIRYEWIQREENREADLLSAKAVGIEFTRKKDTKISLVVGNAYEFTFDDDERIRTVKDERFNREIQRYYVKRAVKEGKNISGNYFETGSKKLNEKLNYYKPLSDKKFRIIPTKANNWVEYMVEEIIDD